MAITLACLTFKTGDQVFKEGNFPTTLAKAGLVSASQTKHTASAKEEVMTSLTHLKQV